MVVIPSQLMARGTAQTMIATRWWNFYKAPSLLDAVACNSLLHDCKSSFASGEGTTSLRALNDQLQIRKAHKAATQHSGLILDSA